MYHHALTSTLPMTNTDRTPAQLHTPIEQVMDLLTDLHATNLTLQREIQQQQQQIQGLQDAASVTPLAPVTLAPDQLHPPATFGGNQNDCIETWLFQVE